MSNDLPTPESPVLSTLHEDGSRRWMHPRLSRGRFLRLRRIVAYVLIAVFTLVPYLTLNGKPLVLLNIPKREFTLLGFTFLPTDTLLLALVSVATVVGVFLVTALFGRVWCGWMCPQTVYLEFLYRPIQRLFDGPPGPRHRPGKKKSPLRTALKFATYLLLSAFLAHTFLAYFVGVRELALWVRSSPLEHPTAFLVMAFTTAAMMVDFSYFREQTCIVACPYGRFQSVMLDRNSLIVTYDPGRGEPRGKRGRNADVDKLGDCIDCGMCVDTCPTGIDIRNGLQLECIACTQCIDACENVMTKLKKPTGLIRFSSQARIEGEASQVIRPRVLIYPAVMLVLLVGFGFALAGKQSADITVLRGLGDPFKELTPGEITNWIRVKIKNRSGQDAEYKIEVVDDIPATIGVSENPIRVGVNQSRMEDVSIVVPRSVFQGHIYDITLRVSDGADFSEELTTRLQGPYRSSP